MFDDNPEKMAPSIVIGEDLSNMSVEELAERIIALKAEIARCEMDRQSKEQSLSAAEAAFKSPD